VIIFEKKYDGESIIDLPEDVHYAIEDSGVAQDQYGLHPGTFTVTIEWTEEEFGDE